MFSDLRTKIVGTCLLTLLGIGSVGGYLCWQRFERFHSQEVQATLDSAEEVIIDGIRYELSNLRKKVYRFSQIRDIIDAADFGQGAELKVYLKEYLETEDESLSFQFFDFEGDPITTSDQVRKISSEVIRSLVTQGLKGKFQEQIIVVEGDMFVIAAGPLGVDKDPSGVIVVLKPIAAPLQGQVREQTDAHLGFIIDGLILNAGTSQAVLDPLLPMIPKRGSELIGNRFERQVGSLLLRLVALDKISTPANIRWVLGFSEKEHLILVRDLRNIIFLFVLLALVIMLPILVLLCRPVMITLARLREDLAAITHNVLAANRCKIDEEHHTRGLAASVNTIIDGLQGQVELQKGETQKALDRLTRLHNMIDVDDIAFKMFVDNVRVQRTKCEDVIKGLTAAMDDWRGILSQLIRQVHTLKDEANFFDLSHIGKRAQTLEDYLFELRKQKETLGHDDIAEIEKNYLVMTQEIDSYLQIRTQVLKRDVKKVIITEVTNTQIIWLKSLLGKVLAAFSNPFIDRMTADNLYAELERAIFSVGRVDVRDYIERYDKMLQKLCENSPKKIQPIQFKGKHPFFSPVMMTHVNDMLIHCLKNALDHGIENVLKRVKIRKPSEGVLQVKADKIGEVIEIVIQDDGKGISADEIREVATRKGLVTKEQAAALSEQELMPLLFKEGFSTAGRVSLYAGRGLGLSAVQEQVQELKGNLQMVSSPGQGSALKLTFPDEPQVILSRTSCFSLSSHVAAVVEEYYTTLTNIGVSIDTANLSDTNFLVFSDRRWVTLALRKILALLAEILQRGQNLAIEVKHLAMLQSSEKIVSVYFALGVADGMTALPKIMECEKFAELTAMLSDAEGLNIRIDPASGSIVFDVLVNLPTTFAPKPIYMMPFCQDLIEIMPLISRYMSQVLRGWEHHVFAPDKTNEFLERVGGGIGVLFIEEGMLNARGAPKLLGHSGLNVVLLSSDVSAMDPAIVGSIPSEPLVFELPFDSLTIEKSLEMAVTQNLIRGGL